MTNQSLNRVALSTAIVAAMAIPLSAHANYWNEQICGMSTPTRISPGESFDIAFAVSANRDADSNIPVEFYYSQSSSVGLSSIYLGSTSVFLPFIGNYCSSTAHKTVTLPTTSQGMNCFIPNKSYIIAKTGDDEQAFPFQPRDGDNLPQITSSTPSEGRPGSLVHVVGQNINSSTGIRVSQENLSQALIGSELLGIIGSSTSSGSISLQNIEHNYCVPPLSVGSNFTVLPAAQYCASGAMAEGFGRISQVAMNGYNNDQTTSSTCPTYTDNTGFYGLTSLGTNPESLYFKLNACGAAAYDRLMKVYVDWNNDLDFEDAGETVLEAPYIGVDTLYQLNFAVPATAKAGTTRMRIITALYYTGYVDNVSDVGACGYYPYGETQDYAIDLVPSGFGLSAIMPSTGKELSAESLKEVMESTDSIESATLLENGKPVKVKASGLRLN